MLIRKWNKLIGRLSEFRLVSAPESLKIAAQINHIHFKIARISSYYWRPGYWNIMFAGMVGAIALDDYNLSYTVDEGSAQVEIATRVRSDNSATVFSKEINVFTMYPDVKNMIKPVRDFKFLQFLKRNILAIERIQLIDATQLTFIQAISQLKSDDGQRLGWTRARNVLRAYQPVASKISEMTLSATCLIQTLLIS